MTRITYALLLVTAWGCSTNNELSDGYGNFEATEVLVSAEASGKLMALDVEEGDRISAGMVLGYVDTVQAFLQKEQLKASINALSSKTQHVQSQINVLLERKNNLEREKRRLGLLLQDDAATQKQLDDIIGEIEVVNRQMVATRTQLENSNRGILSEIDPLEIKIAQMNDQINKSIVTNPITGTVLAKYSEPHEVVSFGMPLYKIANLDRVYLRVYLSGDQIPGFNIGQEVEVLVDKGDGGILTHHGTITWISEKAEFTPKIIQTREERVNLVYAMKVNVPNDGSLKIGMPGEINRIDE